MSKNLTKNSIGQATVIIAVFSLLAKLLGFLRDAIFSHEFGLDPVIGVYYAAFRVPDFIYNLLILGTFSVAFIPVFSEYLLRDKDKANRLASSIINTTLVLVSVLSVLAYILVDPLVRAVAPGFGGAEFELTKTFTKIFLLSPLLLTLSSIVSSMLNAHKKFLMVSVAPLFYNLSIIFGALVLFPRFGAAGLAWGVILGAVLHFAVQVPQIFRTGFRYTMSIDWNDIGFKKFWKLYLPRVFSMGTDQVSALIITIFGSFLGTSALAAYYYANNLQSVVLSVFAVSFAIAVFPLLSDLFNQKDDQGFKDVLAKTTIQILYFVVPASILLLVLRAQVVRLILGAGEGTSFSFEHTKIVAESLGLFSISLFAQSLIPLFNRAFYARQNTIIPVVIGFITIGANVLLTYYFVGRLGIAGMALSFSITNILNLVILMMELHYKLGNIHDEYLIVNCLKIVIASLVSGTSAYVSLYMLAPLVGTTTYFGVLTQGVFSGLIGVSVYLGITWLLGLPETRNLVNLLRTTAQKIGRPINIIFNWWS